MLSKQEIIETFVNTFLKENYNFLEEDLVTLANAFVSAAKRKIEYEERAKCIKIANNLNKNVGEKIELVRKNNP